MLNKSFWHSSYLFSICNELCDLGLYGSCDNHNQTMTCVWFPASVLMFYKTFFRRYEESNQNLYLSILAPLRLSSLNARYQKN